MPQWRVRDVMTTDVITASGDATVAAIVTARESAATRCRSRARAAVIRAVDPLTTGP